MPKLQPIPIRTKEVPFPVALARWIFTIRRWTLLEDWSFVLPEGREGHKMVIPAGFQCDGASIPRIFWMVLSPTGLLLIPALLHDYAYKHRYLWEELSDGSRRKFGEGNGRLDWDTLFRDVAIHVNGFVLINYIAWLALVAFGWMGWRSFRKREAKGEAS